jgi:hypothetical protein
MSGIMQMMFGGGAGDAILVASVTGTASSPTPNSLSAAVGDLAIGCTVGQLSSGSGVTWTSIGIGGLGSTWYRFLTSADMTAPIVSNAGNMVLYIVRGATSLSTVVTDSGVAATPHFRTVSGFTRATNHAGLIAFTVNSSATPGAPASTAAPVTSPVSFTTNSLAPVVSSGTHILALAYRFAPPADAYVNNAAFTYGDGLSTGNARTQYLGIIELLR